MLDKNPRIGTAAHAPHLQIQRPGLESQAGHGRTNRGRGSGSGRRFIPGGGLVRWRRGASLIFRRLGRWLARTGRRGRGLNLLDLVGGRRRRNYRGRRCGPPSVKLCRARRDYRVGSGKKPIVGNKGRKDDHGHEDNSDCGAQDFVFARTRWRRSAGPSAFFVSKQRRQIGGRRRERHRRDLAHDRDFRRLQIGSGFFAAEAEAGWRRRIQHPGQRTGGSGSGSRHARRRTGGVGFDREFWRRLIQPRRGDGRRRVGGGRRHRGRFRGRGGPNGGRLGRARRSAFVRQSRFETDRLGVGHRSRRYRRPHRGSGSGRGRWRDRHRSGFRRRSGRGGCRRRIFG